jgi:aspartokinase
LETLDYITSFGELIASTIVSQFCGLNFIDTRTVFKTNSDYTHAEINQVITKQLMLAKIKTIAPLKDNSIAMAGFIGSDENNHTTTIGRNGSDYTAALVANFIDAADLTI